MQKIRHDLFQQMTLALSHQQNGNVTLALAYWENVLRLLPDEIAIHNEILKEYDRIAEEAQLLSQIAERIRRKLERLTQTYRKEFPDEDHELFQLIYRAMCQQCGGNYSLALVYWENILAILESDALVITLAVQDFCWKAHQYLKAGSIQKCIELYQQFLPTFPEFFEGYLNLSLILHQYGFAHEVLPQLASIPSSYRKEFIVSRYFDLYRKIEEISKQFDLVPYAAIEKIINDLRVENTFYPSINQEYFTRWITELIDREKRFFEKRRKALEQKAIAKTSKQLVHAGIALGHRVTMAKQAKSEDIYKFLYDNDIRIAEALLDNPNMTAEDVLIIAQTSYVSEILSLISTHYKWGVLQNIRMAILCNPQTLPQDSIRILPFLSLNDLSRIFHKKTIPTEVRIRAKTKIQQIFHQLPRHEKIAVIEASSGEIFRLLDNVQFDLSSFLIDLIGKFYDHTDIVVNICRWKLTPASILAFIGNNAQLISTTQIKFALLSNPKTPAKTLTSLLRSIPEKDAQFLLSNTHIPSSVREMIATLFPNNLL